MGEKDANAVLGELTPRGRRRGSLFSSKHLERKGGSFCRTTEDELFCGGQRKTELVKSYSKNKGPRQEKAIEGNREERCRLQRRTQAAKKGKGLTRAHSWEGNERRRTETSKL